MRLYAQGSLADAGGPWGASSTLIQRLDTPPEVVIIAQVYADLCTFLKDDGFTMSTENGSLHQGGWLTLGQAAAFLGVHPATLRRWADEGEVRCVRTPGGHRRFSQETLGLFVEGPTEPALTSSRSALQSSLVLQTRRELRSSEAAQMGWHKAFRDEELATRRSSGRRLLGLAIQFTSRSTGREAILEEARSIGDAYGRDAVARGLSLVETTKAFLFFRESLIQWTRPGLSNRGRYDAEDVRIHRSLREFLDQVLYAAMAAYEEALLGSLPSPQRSE